MQRDAAELADGLARRIQALVRELLPNGRREGSEWRVGSVAGERGASLSVCLRSDKAGVWRDFASGDGGDALDLVAAIRFGGDRRQAMEWARAWLGGARRASRESREPPAAAAATSARAKEPGAEDPGTRAARRIFFQAAPFLIGTPVESYLRARGIELAELPRLPWALRFHPGLDCAEVRRGLPAMVAAVSAADGRITAVHRTWLAQDRNGTWRKAKLRDPKKSLGPVAGSFIRLSRGASGKALAASQGGETVVVAEGIETGLSIAVACPELRVLCAVSLGNAARIALPAGMRTVILAVDNDGDNPAAARGLRKAVEALTAAGHAVRLARSPLGKDFNDALAHQAA